MFVPFYYFITRPVLLYCHRKEAPDKDGERDALVFEKETRHTHLTILSYWYIKVKMTFRLPSNHLRNSPAGLLKEKEEEWTQVSSYLRI